MDTQTKGSQQEMYPFFSDQASFNMDMIPSFWSHVGPWKREPEEKHSGTQKWTWTSLKKN